MGSAEESRPLLNAQPAAVTSEPSKKDLQRSWRFPLWHIIGDASTEDVVAGCLAWQLPVLAFGWNMKRALQASFWREVALIVLFLGGSYLLLSVSAHALFFSCAGWPERPIDGPDGTGLPEDPPMGSKGPLGRRGGCHHLSDMLSQLPDECRSTVIGGMAFLAIVAVAVVTAAVVYAARRRQQIRETFGIEGSFRGDLLTWAFCSPCALAQETRTLMAAQVHDGVWHGPMVNNAPPTAQQMV